MNGLRPKTFFTRGALILLLLGSLLLAACGQFSVDLSFDGSSNGGSPGAVTNSSLFILLLVILVAIFALVLITATIR